MSNEQSDTDVEFKRKSYTKDEDSRIISTKVTNKGLKINEISQKNMRMNDKEKKLMT